MVINCVANPVASVPVGRCLVKVLSQARAVSNIASFNYRERSMQVLTIILSKIISISRQVKKISS